MQFIEKDIFRMYALRVATEHKLFNRYDALIPFEGSETQTLGEGCDNWSIVPGDDWCWNFDGETVYLNKNATSPLFLALMKVKR